MSHKPEADACILTGGTPIYDYDHASRIIHCRLPRLLGKELICFGIGVKPVRSFHGKRLVRWLLKDAAAVSTRDPSSERELIAAVADRLTETGYDVVFVPMHKAQGDDDTAEIAEIRGRLNETSAVAVYLGSPQKALEILGRMELVLGLRLHSLILAATAGVPIVGIDYDPKIRGFMEHAGAEDYLSGVEDSPEALMHRVEKALDNRKSMKRRLLGSCERMRAKINEEAQHIAEIINREC